MNRSARTRLEAIEKRLAKIEGKLKEIEDSKEYDSLVSLISVIHANLDTMMATLEELRNDKDKDPRAPDIPKPDLPKP